MRKKYAAGALSAAVLLLAACSSHSGSTGQGNTTSTGGKYGGTLFVLMHGGMSLANDNLDPATSNAQESEDMLPLFESPLTMYVPGSNPTQIAGDLATDAGEPSDGAKTWTFHLRKGITYQDGTQVTA